MRHTRKKKASGERWPFAILGRVEEQTDGKSVDVVIKNKEHHNILAMEKNAVSVSIVL